MKAQADQTQLADEIAALGTEMDAWEKDQANLTAEREAEKVQRQNMWLILLVPLD